MQLITVRSELNQICSLNMFKQIISKVENYSLEAVLPIRNVYLLSVLYIFQIDNDTQTIQRLTKNSVDSVFGPNGPPNSPFPNNSNFLLSTSTTKKSTEQIMNTVTLQKRIIIESHVYLLLFATTHRHVQRFENNVTNS